MDYHNIGFRECAAEVARYLVSVEGMDVQDPMRLRLMSHLQCFATQRELSNKPVTGSSGVTSPTSNSTTPSSVNTPAPSNAWPFPAAPGYATTNVNSSGHNFNNHSSNSGQQSVTPVSGSVFEQSAHHYGMDMSNSFGHPSAANAARLHHHPHAGMSHHHHSGGSMTTLQPVQPGHPHHPASAPYPHVNHHPFPTLAAQNASYSTSGNQVRPYRPWGAELAY